MKKLWKVMSVLLCGAMLLTGCGNTKVAQNSGTIEEKKDSVYTTFSDIKNSGDLVILFLTNYDQKPEKDSTPMAIFILENGKVYGDHVPHTTFGEYSKMTDEEIKQCVLSNGDKDTYSYANDMDYEIAVYTDSTGNNTQYESLLVKDCDCDDLYIYGLMQIYANTPAYETVYESNYIGMNMIFDEDWYGSLWYRDDGDLIMALDEPTAKGILVDPKEEFESNAYKEGM